MNVSERVLIGPEDAAVALGISRTAVFELLARGELASARVGKRRLISRKSVEDWAARQMAASGFPEAS